MTKEDRLQKEKLIGTIVSMPVPAIAEMASLVGLDWVMIDMEHSALSLSDVEGLIQAVKGSCLSIVRVPENNHVWINRVLDLGCDGLMIPKINSARHAQSVISAGRYYPLGERGIGMSRSNQYGLTSTQNANRLNREPLLLLQIEHIDAVRNLDEILKVKGFDAVFVGPYDLSSSLGVAGQVNHHSVINAIDHIKRRCTTYQMPFGYFGANPKAVEKEVKQGAKYILVGMDGMMITKGMQEIIQYFEV